MKKVLSLLICFSLFFCCACKKDDQAPHADDKTSSESFECGTLYTSAGNTYNTHVRMRLANEELVAPVQALIVEIQNDTDYRVNLLGKIEAWECEKWEDGQWVPQKVGVVRENLYTDSVSSHSKQSWTISYAGDLSEGVYRLQRIVKLQVPDNSPDPDKKECECVIDAYFTIAPLQD